MTTHSSLTIREIYEPTCRQLLEIRDKVAQEVLEEARKSQDVQLSYHEASMKAENMVAKGFNRFEVEVKQAFQRSPASDIATMFLGKAKSHFFFSSMELFGTVIHIITGKKGAESSSEAELEWQ
ncbi:MAG: hypothetical protein AB7N99_01150 [Simkaniaceae bacterium]|jgi:hypothetical protein